MILDKKNIFNNKKPKRLSPGKYDSKIVKVEDAPGWVPGSAFVVHYELTDPKSGIMYAKTELYLSKLTNPRTKRLVDYLESKGEFIEETEDLVGIVESVTLAWEDVDDHVYLNIVDREYIGRDVEEVTEA